MEEAAFQPRPVAALVRLPVGFSEGESRVRGSSVLSDAPTS